MKIPPTIRTYGDPKWRGKCPKEGTEQASFFNRIRQEYPETWGRIAVHIRNEDSLATAQKMQKHKLEGLTAGASDIQIPGNPSLCIELKRMDHSQSKLSDEQLKYLIAAKDAGAFACVALGAAAAWDAFEEWRGLQCVS